MIFGESPMVARLLTCQIPEIANGLIAVVPRIALFDEAVGRIRLPVLARILAGQYTFRTVLLASDPHHPFRIVHHDS